LIPVAQLGRNWGGLGKDYYRIEGIHPSQAISLQLHEVTTQKWPIAVATIFSKSSYDAGRGVAVAQLGCP